MIATPHILVGAAAGRKLRVGWLALMVALVSHFALDCVPHLDWNGLRRAGVLSFPGMLTCAAADVLLGMAIVYLLSRRQSSRKMMIACAAVAIVPDLFRPGLIWFPAFGGHTLLAAFPQFHHMCQRNVSPSSWCVGVLTQLAITILAVLLMRPKSPKDSRQRNRCRPRRNHS